MKEWFIDMFQAKGATTKLEEYNMAAGRDETGKNIKIKMRLDALMKSYDDFLQMLFIKIILMENFLQFRRNC